MQGRHQFLQKENPTLGANALERIIARGINQTTRKEITTQPILNLVNSEPHIYCSDVDPTKAHVAFGRWGIPKLKKELLSSDPLLSKRAILSLLDMVYDPEKAVDVVKLQVIPRTIRLMLSEDVFVREHILTILQVLAIQPGGKTAIVNHNTILQNLSTLLDDINNIVRTSAAKTVRALASWYSGVEALIKHGFIPVLIRRLDLELDDEIMVILLESLEFLLDQDMEAKLQGLKNEGIELAVLLGHSVDRIWSGGAAILSQLLRHHEGKKAVLDHRTDIISTLTDLLEDRDAGVRTHAAAALMFILCKTEAKIRCLKLPTPNYLYRCAQAHRFPGLQLNSIKTLTSFAESPGGQDLLKSNIRLIEDIRCADSIVRRHKNILLTVINRVI